LFICHKITHPDNSNLTDNIDIWFSLTKKKEGPMKKSVI